MTPIDPSESKLAPAPSPDDTACVHALAAVRDHLLAIPPPSVLRPNGDELTLAARVLAHIAEASRADAEEEVRLARLELLAHALVRAQHEFVWEPPCKLVERYDSLVAPAEQVFHNVEALSRLLVRRAVLTRRDLLRAVRGQHGETPDDRCRYVCELVEVLAEHQDGDAPKQLLRRAEQLALELEGARPAVGRAVSAREVRDRAYTALHAALQAIEHTALDPQTRWEHSGVFALDVVDGALAGVRCA